MIPNRRRTMWAAASVAVAVTITGSIHTVVQEHITPVSAATTATSEDAPPVRRPLDNSCWGGHVAFTFDDGSWEHTETLLDTLEALGIEAVFSWNGDKVEGWDRTTVRAVAEQHVTPNHTWGHPDMTTGELPDGTREPWSTEWIRSELERTNEFLMPAGAPRPTLYLPPYGAINEQVEGIARELALRLVMPWGHHEDDNIVDSHDNEGATTHEIIDSTVRSMRDESIITMHDVQGQATLNSVQALQALVDAMNEKGLCAATEVRKDAIGRLRAMYGRRVLDVRLSRYAENTFAPGLPKRIAAVYWTSWNQEIRLTQVPQSYNVIYLFAAVRLGDEGAIGWAMHDIAADINVVRARGQRVILSAGGAGQGIDFSSRTVSQRFIDSVVRINAELGGTVARPMIDGVDFNTFEAEATPNTAEYLWMFAELKRVFGQGFGITSPPAPWKDDDKVMIREALSKDLMTYAGPQFYGGPGLADPQYIIETTRDWVTDVAGGDASKIVLGFGMENLADYSSVEQILTAWRAIEEEFPEIRGVYLWQHKTDFDREWAFARRLVPLVINNAILVKTMPSVPPPPTQPPGPVVSIGSASYLLAGIDIAREADALVAYTDEVASTSTNPYGCEVAVAGGKIVGIVDRQSGEKTHGTPIPHGGYVLSGHGEARAWLLSHASIGAAVEGVTTFPRTDHSSHS